MSVITFTTEYAYHTDFGEQAFKKMTYRCYYLANREDIRELAEAFASLSSYQVVSHRHIENTDLEQ